MPKTATIPLAIEKHGLGWRVSSTTQPGLFYYVSLLGRQSCTCGAYLYSRANHLTCKHIHAVVRMLKEREVAYRG